MITATNYNTPKLDVLIATHGSEGLNQVAQMTLPQVDGVRYIVTWQTGAGYDNDTAVKIPEKLNRPDLKITPIKSTGLSNNRNAGMSLAEAPYCLIADNDLHYTADALKSVIDTFDKNPGTDIAVFRHSGDNSMNLVHPATLDKRLPKGFSVTSFDTAYRRESIGGIHFDPNFGIGAPLSSGEDTLFLLDCRRRGLHCRYYPITIVRHNGPTTGHRAITDPNIAAAEGACTRLEYGMAGFPRIILFAWRAKRNGRMPLLWGLRHLARGFFSKYVRLHRRNYM